MHRSICTVVCAALISLVGAKARADAVAPPPDDCPRGTVAQTCHGEPYCEPQACDSDAACPMGQQCERRSFCVRTSTCGGGWGGEGFDVTDARGSCGDGAACPPDRTCQELAVCMPRRPAEDASAGIADGGHTDREHTRYGCGCRVGGGASSSFAGLALVLALGTALARRSRRR